MSGGKRSFSLYDDDSDSESHPANNTSKEGNAEPLEKKTRIEDPKSFELLPSSSFSRSLLYGLGTRIGERDEMQDAHLIIDCLLPERTDMKRCALFGIFDGHAGSRAAIHCEKNLSEELKKKMNSCPDIPTIEKSLKRHFTETFKQMDETFLLEARKQKPTWKDGTTATTVLVLNQNIYSANIGDSRAVVAREKCDNGTTTVVPVQLTVDHSPQQYDERMRIQKAGGMVKDGRIMGILEVSRSIGDGQFKTQGVTSIPDMKKLTITKNDRFLLIACDGLWKCFTNEEAIKFVIEHLEKENTRKEEDVPVHDKKFKTKIWETVADKLAAEAVRRKCGDNVSVLLVELSVDE